MIIFTGRMFCFGVWILGFCRALDLFSGAL